MIKVKTFTTPLKVFHTHEELEELDQQVNSFLADNSIDEVVSVNDAQVTDNTGATIGLVRVLAYRA